MKRSTSHRTVLLAIWPFSLFVNLKQFNLTITWLTLLDLYTDFSLFTDPPRIQSGRNMGGGSSWTNINCENITAAWVTVS